MTGVICPSYRSGFASPQRNRGRLKYPRLWRGCVGAWNMGLGATGLTLMDQSGYGNHGTLANMIPTSDWVASDGKVALDFDGSDDYVSVPDVRLDGSAQIIMSYWILTRKLSGSMIIDKTPVNTRWSMFLEANRLKMRGGSAATTLQTTNEVTAMLNTWTHVAGVIDGTNGTIYINGVVEASGTVVALGDAAGVMHLGRYDSGYYCDMQLDDVRIYKRVLPTDQIKLLATRRGIAYEMQRSRVGNVATVAARNRNYAWSPF